MYVFRKKKRKKVFSGAFVAFTGALNRFQSMDRITPDTVENKEAIANEMRQVKQDFHRGQTWMSQAKKFATHECYDRLVGVQNAIQQAFELPHGSRGDAFILPAGELSYVASDLLYNH